MKIEIGITGPYVSGLIGPVVSAKYHRTKNSFMIVYFGGINLKKSHLRHSKACD